MDLDFSEDCQQLVLMEVGLVQMKEMQDVVAVGKTVVAAVEAGKMRMIAAVVVVVFEAALLLEQVVKAADLSVGYQMLVPCSGHCCLSWPENKTRIIK